ncbi:dienelactone hydrolase family protein [Ilumatobacter nonamiensis]|uniref:dienelactone hydrolase family protein n=1 Tax=Ilumatobacter nonamiensis TaxID=467093 RepID=UPI00034D0EC3|nr:dienelactone hydrolase family protein [Ilumatobacter nonamiensis]
METREEIIDTSTDDGDMAVLVTRPTDDAPGDGDWPAVLLFIDAPGIRSATHEFAAKLAGEGYLVVVPDLHHRQGRLLNAMETAPPDGTTTQEMVWGWIAAMTDDQIQHDGDRALAAAGVSEDTPILTIGFCLGARAVFRRMMRDGDRVLAGAAWHPSFLADDEPDSPHQTADQLARPLYLAIGDADQVQSIEMHQRFLDAVAPLDHVVVEIFEGADHGFTWPGAPNYHEAASNGAWDATTALFARATN